MYVSGDGAPGGVCPGPGAEQFVDDKIFALSSTGGVTDFATLPGDSDVVDLGFPPPGSTFGDILYGDANNRDGFLSCDQGGAVLDIDDLGNASDFTAVPPVELNEPGAIAFGPGNDFGSDLYIRDSDTFGVTGIYKVDDTGGLTIFLGSSPSVHRPIDIAFGPGGTFGDDLFFTEVNCDCIKKVDPFGTVSPDIIPFGTRPRSLVFGPGGAFGEDLYVSVDPSELLVVQADGTSALFATGFQNLRGNGPFAFSLDGQAMFVADAGANKIYRISAKGIEFVIDTLQEIVDQNPNTPLADKLEDVIAKLHTAFFEFGKAPPDNQAAVGTIEGAIGDLEAALKDGLLDAILGADLADDLTGIARQTAMEALDEAKAQGGDIADAEMALSDGDALRDDALIGLAEFKEAVAEYKVALAEAESML